jgi:hypothetical protein
MKRSAIAKNARVLMMTGAERKRTRDVPHANVNVSPFAKLFVRSL